MKKKLNPSKNPAIDYVSQRRKDLYFLKFKRWTKWFIGLLVLIISMNNLDYISKACKNYLIELSAELGFKLNNIIIEGQKNLDIKELLSQFNADNNTPIFAIDLNETKKIVEQNTWLKKAIIRRSLPYTIQIMLVEKEPVALWQYKQEMFLIDADGSAIKGDVQKFNHLLHFVGQGANVYAAELMKMLEDKKQLSEKLQSIVRVGNRRWNLIFQNGTLVKLPEFNTSVALEYLNQKYLEGSFTLDKIKVLDMRDNEKYYIEKY
jgi:cell division protein FtsQ